MSEHKLGDPTEAAKRLLAVAVEAGVKEFEDDAVTVSFALADHLAAREADRVEIERLRESRRSNAEAAEQFLGHLDSICAALGLPADATAERMTTRAKRPATSQDEMRRLEDNLRDALNERDALRAELVATLRESVVMGCVLGHDDEHRETFDSQWIGTYAGQLRRLASLGQVEIISDDGRRVIARWKVTR